MKSLHRVQLFVTPWTVARQTTPSMGFPAKNTGIGCHFLLQGIFLTQGSNLGLLHCRQTIYHLSHQRRISKVIYLIGVIAQSSLTICDPVDFSPPGSSARGIFQARILEQIAISYSWRSFWPRDWTSVPCISCISREMEKLSKLYSEMGLSNLLFIKHHVFQKYSSIQLLLSSTNRLKNRNVFKALIGCAFFKRCQRIRWVTGKNESWMWHRLRL